MTYVVAAALLVVGVALFVSAPLYGDAARASARRPDAQRERLEHERALAIQGLRELELDRQMNKLSRTDYEELRSRLEARALRAMGALERLSPTIERGWLLSDIEASPERSKEARSAEPESTLPKAKSSDEESSPVFVLSDPESPSSAATDDWSFHQPAAQADELQSTLRAAFCPSCGARLKARPRFCTACGVRLSGAQ